MDVFDIGDAIEREREQRAREARLADLQRRIDEADAEAERLSAIADQAIEAELAARRRVQALRAELTHENVASLYPMQPRTQQ